MNDLRTTEFPMDWNEFRNMWNAWRDEHADVLKRSSYRWPAKSFMANEILWRGAIGTRQVELSEVTFGPTRYIGITFAQASGTYVPENGLVTTFEALERELGL